MAAALQDGCSSTTPIPVADRLFGIELAKTIAQMKYRAMTLCRSSDAADDLLQQAALKAWQARRSFEPGTNMKAWLYVILRNTHRTQQRRAWRMVQLDETKAGALPQAGNQSAAADLSDVVRKIGNLPRNQRSAFLRVVVEGASYREAAIESGCALGTVKSQVARARTTLLDDIPGPVNRGPRPPPGAAASALLQLVAPMG